jgi:hypothetical protein
MGPTDAKTTWDGLVNIRASTAHAGATHRGIRDRPVRRTAARGGDADFEALALGQLVQAHAASVDSVGFKIQRFAIWKLVEPGQRSVRPTACELFTLRKPPTLA